MKKALADYMKTMLQEKKPAAEHPENCIFAAIALKGSMFYSFCRRKEMTVSQGADLDSAKSAFYRALKFESKFLLKSRISPGLQSKFHY